MKYHGLIVESDLTVSSLGEALSMLHKLEPATQFLKLHCGYDDLLSVSCLTNIGRYTITHRLLESGNGAWMLEGATNTIVSMGA